MRMVEGLGRAALAHSWLLLAGCELFYPSLNSHLLPWGSWTSCPSPLPPPSFCLVLPGNSCISCRWLLCPCQRQPTSHGPHLAPIEHTLPSFVPPPPLPRGQSRECLCGPLFSGPINNPPPAPVTASDGPSLLSFQFPHPLFLSPSPGPLVSILQHLFPHCLLTPGTTPLSSPH